MMAQLGKVAKLDTRKPQAIEIRFIKLSSDLHAWMGTHFAKVNKCNKSRLTGWLSLDGSDPTVRTLALHVEVWYTHNPTTEFPELLTAAGWPEPG